MTLPTDQWLAVRAHLVQHRHALAVRAADEYPHTPRVAGTPLLTDPRWMLEGPVRLADLVLSHHPDRVFHGVDGADRAPIDYAAWPFAARLTGELGGRLRVSCLGMGVDPAHVRHRPAHPSRCSTRRCSTSCSRTWWRTTTRGACWRRCPSPPNVDRFAHDEPTQAAAAALLALAWRHREALLA
jgi:hypothetical protein